MVDQSIQSLQYIEHLSYLGTFFSVGLSGYVIPIPEEAILILSGYLAAQGITHLYAVMVVCVLGAIGGDSLIYYLSSHGSAFTEKYVHKIESSQMGWYMRAMRRDTMRTIFLSRFIVGMRFLNPLVSGLMKIPFQRFIVASAASAMIYIPCIIFLGYYFSSQINLVLHIAHSVREIILSALLIGSLLLILFFFRNLVRKTR
jgi:membrane protein DedA with SNARE-associated domain